jgi:adenylate cyclase class 1
MLARDIVAFYQNQTAGNKEDNLIRECLFLKTLEGMKQQGNKKHQQRIMTLMKNWDLLPQDLGHFMQVTHWNYNELLEVGTEVHNYLLSTYKRLRWFFTTFAKDTGLTITQRDISILGRKLFTFYQSKPDKIEYIRSLSRDIMLQKDITFHITRYEGVNYFYAFQDELSQDAIKTNPNLQIRRETNIITLMTWLTVNGIINKSTNLYLTKNFMHINLTEIQAVTNKLFEKFPLIKFSHIPANELLEKETVIQCLCIINFHKLPVHGEKELHSSIISLNNYGEHFIHHYTTITQLKNQFRLLLTKHFVSRWNNNLEIYIPNQPEQYYIEEMLK